MTRSMMSGRLRPCDRGEPTFQTRLKNCRHTTRADCLCTKLHALSYLFRKVGGCSDEREAANKVWSRECRDLCNKAPKRDSYEVNWLGADCLDQAWQL